MSLATPTCCERRVSPRAWFSLLPNVWITCGDEVFDGHCVNVSSSGSALRVGASFPVLQPGAEVEVVFMSPRRETVAVGILVGTRQVGASRNISICFHEKLDELENMIETALSCTNAAFSAGSATIGDGKVRLYGKLSGATARDLGYMIGGSREVDMSGVRELDAEGVRALMDIRARQAMTLFGCRHHIAMMICENFGGALCDRQCPNWCADNDNCCGGPAGVREHLH